jgi:streptomycin 6-kinase
MDAPAAGFSMRLPEQRRTSGERGASVTGEREIGGVPARRWSAEAPPGLSWWRKQPGGADWLDRLPRLVGECAALWGLEVGPAYPGSHVSLVAPVTRGDGTPAVLKINFPDEESEHEPDALAHWDGRGAVRLLACDRERAALLVERCEPGTALWTVEDEEEANRIAADVLRRLWKPAPADHPFRPLAVEAESWAVELGEVWEKLGRPFERRLVEEAVSIARELGSSQGEAVVLHQDYHGGNVLRAEREAWLAIDPKPLVGEREFDAASLLRDRRDELALDPKPQRRVQRRLDQLAAELELDRERMRGWGIVHALAWGVSGIGKVEQDMLDCARWLTAS